MVPGGNSSYWQPPVRIMRPLAFLPVFVDAVKVGGPARRWVRYGGCRKVAAVERSRALLCGYSLTPSEPA